MLSDLKNAKITFPDATAALSTVQLLLYACSLPALVVSELCANNVPAVKADVDPLVKVIEYRCIRVVSPVAASAPSRDVTLSIEIASGTNHNTGTRSLPLVPFPSDVVNVVAGSVDVPNAGAYALVPKFEFANVNAWGVTSTI